MICHHAPKYLNVLPTRFTFRPAYKMQSVNIDCIFKWHQNEWRLFSFHFSSAEGLQAAISGQLGRHIETHSEDSTNTLSIKTSSWYETHCCVFEVVEAVVRQNEPPSLPGFHSAPWQEEKEEKGSDTKATVTDWLSPIRKKSGDVTLVNDAGPHPLCFLPLIIWWYCINICCKFRAPGLREMTQWKNTMHAFYIIDSRCVFVSSLL